MGDKTQEQREPFFLREYDGMPCIDGPDGCPVELTDDEIVGELNRLTIANRSLDLAVEAETERIARVIAAFTKLSGSRKTALLAEIGVTAIRKPTEGSDAQGGESEPTES